MSHTGLLLEMDSSHDCTAFHCTNLLLAKSLSSSYNVHVYSFSWYSYFSHLRVINEGQKKFGNSISLSASKEILGGDWGRVNYCI